MDILSDPLISIVILTWNRRDDLVETLTHIKHITITYPQIEIIVVDNNSDDGTEEVIKEQFPCVRLIKLSKNTGIAGYNKGIKEARGQYILLLDSDSYPSPFSLHKMIKVFQSDRDIGAVAFEVLNAAFKAPSSGVSRDHLLNNKSLDNIRIDNITGSFIESYNGAGVGFSKICLERAGLLFEPFFLYLNEQEHSIRILASGYKIFYSKEIVAYHKTSTVSRILTTKPYFYTRNLLWIVWSFFPIKEIIIFSLKFFFYLTVASIQQKTAIYLTAVKDAVLNMPQIIARRKNVGKELTNKIRIPIKWILSNYG